MTRLSISARLRSWCTGQGAIRLPEEADGDWEDATGEKATGLPFFLSEPQAEDAGYTSAHLLFECVLASLWNLLCLVYLLHHPTPLDPRTGRPLQPSPRFLYVLLALIAVPLVIGLGAGAGALRGEGEAERQARESRGGWKSVCTGVATVGCCVALWPIIAFVVRFQSRWLQLDLGLTTLCIQALVVRAATGNLYDDATAEEKRGVYEVLRDDMAEKEPLLVEVVERDAVKPRAAAVQIHSFSA
ncbi:hypothetical protein JCM21900_004831 [Sporobolomyces salmonicolor]